jgi:tetratricopeptide (TPR) repeat protein
LGAFDPGLVEPQLRLANLLQRAGRHREAIVHYRRAIHVQRINAGLSVAEQLPLLEGLLGSQLALRDYPSANATQERLFRLRKTNAASAQGYLQAVRAYGRWKCARFLRDRGQGSFRELVDIYLAHDDELRRLQAQAPDDALLEVPHLYERMQLEYLISNYQGERWTGARSNTGGAAAVGYESGGDLAAERFRLLRKHNYRNGRKTLERAVALIQSRSPADSAGNARALIALGDWHMWWNQVAPALHSYRQAWDVYQSDESESTQAESLFTTPRVLPEASPFFFADESDPAVDRVSALVRFDVTRHGEATHIEFLEVEAVDDRSARAAVYRMLKASRFRPAVRDGDAVEFTGLVRRYAYNYH